MHHPIVNKDTLKRMLLELLGVQNFTLDINRFMLTCETLIEAERNSRWVRYFFLSSSSSQAIMYVLTESANLFIISSTQH
jgi:hypothetical protein